MKKPKPSCPYSATRLTTIAIRSARASRPLTQAPTTAGPTSSVDEAQGLRAAEEGPIPETSLNGHHLSWCDAKRIASTAEGDRIPLPCKGRKNPAWELGLGCHDARKHNSNKRRCPIAYRRHPSGALAISPFRSSTSQDARSTQPKLRLLWRRRRGAWSSPTVVCATGAGSLRGWLP